MFNFGKAGLFVTAIMLMCGFASLADAQINVITVDITPFVSPGPSSFGAQNTMGQALQNVDQGGEFNVTEVTPPAFAAMTCQQLSAFDLIAINNHPVRLGGALATLGTNWHCAVGINCGGRVVLTSHDAPRFHMNAPPGSFGFGFGSPGPGVEPFGAPDLVRQSALWAGGSQTGLLIFNESTGFGFGGSGWGNPQLNLPVAWGITDLNAEVPNGFLLDGGYTDILAAFAAHPIYSGLSDARFGVNTISSFSANIGDASFHNIFFSFNAAIFTPTEVLINSGVLDVGNFGVGNNAAGAANGHAITLIRDISCCDPVEDPDVRTQGFWKRVCKKPHPSGEDELLPTYVNCVKTTATFADVDDLCVRLRPKSKKDKCEQAEAQFMALLLNICSGRVATCNCVDDPDLGEATVGEVADVIDFLLSNPDRTFEDCVLAQAIADRINNGLTLVDCP